MKIKPKPNTPVVYPSSDGKRMAENTKQFNWIVLIKENLEILFQHQTDVFVAGDNLIYPVEGDPKIRTAPDVYVAFGRPKGNRGSYQVWLENNVFPQVIFEVLSPGNRPKELREKREFYSQYGAQEYFVYDPDRNLLEVWIRQDEELVQQAIQTSFTSPRLGITFELAEPELIIRHPDGQPFERLVAVSNRANTMGQLAEQQRTLAEEAARLAQQEKLRADQEAEKAAQEKLRADQEAEKAAQEKLRADDATRQLEQLKALLRASGIDPDQQPTGNSDS
jgi:Uma2 family endonuclease